jgi:hypothetical protein
MVGGGWDKVQMFWASSDLRQDGQSLEEGTAVNRAYLESPKQ